MLFHDPGHVDQPHIRGAGDCRTLADGVDLHEKETVFADNRHEFPYTKIASDLSITPHSRICLYDFKQYNEV